MKVNLSVSLFPLTMRKIQSTRRSAVRSQSYGALKIIVVDDGSRDQTAAIARCHAQIDTRVRLIEQAKGQWPAL